MAKTAMDTRRLKELVNGWCYNVRHREHGVSGGIKSVDDRWRKFFKTRVSAGRPQIYICNSYTPGEVDLRHSR